VAGGVEGDPDEFLSKFQLGAAVQYRDTHNKMLHTGVIESADGAGKWKVKWSNPQLSPWSFSMDDAFQRKGVPVRPSGWVEQHGAVHFICLRE
jgi:hypothetical protein